MALVGRATSSAIPDRAAGVLHPAVRDPLIIGLTYVRRDANRRGQPGWLWALVTFPFGWLSVLAYLIVRAAGPRSETNLPLPPPQANLT